MNPTRGNNSSSLVGYSPSHQQSCKLPGYGVRGNSSPLVAHRLLIDSVRTVLVAHPEVPRGQSMDEGWSAGTNAVTCRHSSVGW